MNAQAIAPFLLIIATPIVQIVLLAMKINGHIKTPSGAIAISAFLLGIALSIMSMHIVESAVHPDSSGPRCDIIPMSFLFMGLLITVVATPVIELLFVVLKRLKKRRIDDQLDI